MKRILMTLRCRVIKLSTTHLYKNTNSYAQGGRKEFCSFGFLSGAAQMEKFSVL